MTKKQFDAICAEKKVSWRYEDETDTIEVDAPPGYVMTDSGLHYRSLYLRGWKRAEAYADLADDLRAGIEPCTLEDCDLCEEAKKN
ncbi:MAG: hypothetical protein OEM51_01725 [Gammaproteobacteria bacterium]|nr:hypothetical protein [Gammaproteobacteria bacterium]